jgi:integrase
VVQCLANSPPNKKGRPYQAAFSLVYRVAQDNNKVQINPASRVKRKLEDNGRIRFLSAAEEKRLVTVIRENWPHYLSHFLISLHTGARRREQFSIDWEDVSLSRKTVTLRHTKNGKPQTVPLNSIALAAFEQLKPDEAHGPRLPEHGRQPDAVGAGLVRASRRSCQTERLYLALPSAHVCFPSGNGRGGHKDCRRPHGT